MQALDEVLEQMTQRDILEALREQEQRLRNEFRQQLQESLRNQKRLETRLRVLEDRPRNTEPYSSEGEEQTKRLEEQMEKLEESVKEVARGETRLRELEEKPRNREPSSSEGEEQTKRLEEQMEKLEESVKEVARGETRLRELEEKPRNREPSSSGGKEQTKRLEERVEKLEESVKRALEEVARGETRFRELQERSRNTETSSSGGGEQTKRLEERMEKLELSVRKALEEVFPRVEALVSRLEEPSRSNNSPAVVTSKSSAGFSSKDTAPNTIVPVSQYMAQWKLNKELDVAVEDGKIDDVRRLLGGGADFQEIRPDSSVTPLMMAAKKGHSDVLSMLLEKGANVDTTNKYGSTALTWAAQMDLSGMCVVLLIGAGADVNFKGQNGWTPLHYAAAYGSCITVEALLQAGANKRSLNSVNKAPFNLAKSENIRRLLAY